MSAIPNSVSITPAVTHPSSRPRPGMPDHEGFTFGDFLDVINPLQHLPVIGTFYRRLTGDTMSPTAEIAGGALFGGAIGAAVSIADVLWTQATGKDFGNTVLSWLGFDEDNKTPTQIAKAPSEPEPAAAAPAAKIALEKPPAPTMRIPITPATSAAVPSGTGADLPLLIDAMRKQGVDPAVALRAAAAYRAALGTNALAIPQLAH